ncbi:DNA polymerase alpha subunit B [Drosophila rhopaloa]|uniref:DNA polymerase alpha subunit B n=1 Tax=Drosophila rhopaloa TaxID=1041015 RepID=A0ABM5HYW4_DRORH|nr:DNA polymerase alpha subunit B [Drosophila rhopaloa]
MDVELKQQFDEMGVEPAEAVLDRCMELAISYNVHDATEFVEQWMAFSLSHLHGEDPALDNLGDFERKVLQLRKDKMGSKASAQKATSYAASSVLEASSLATYGVMEDDPMIDDYVSESVADSSAMHTPKAKKNSGRTSNLKGGVLFSPASYTPQSAKRNTAVGTPSSLVAGKPGDIVDSFGHPKLLAGSSWQSQMEHQLPVTQKLLHKDAPLTLANLGYMNDLLAERCDDLHDRVEDTGRALVDKKLGAAAAAECSWYPHDKQALQAAGGLHAVGMVHSEDDGPLDAHSAFLAVIDDSTDEVEDNFLSLNFSRIRSASIFPGQVVLAKGFIPKGKSFVVEEIYTERKLTPPTPLKVDRELQFVVAAGPFTDSTDLFYEPLHDLLKYIKEHRPDVLVLTGPFLDADHKIVGELAETFDSFFEKMIGGIMEAVGIHTTVLVVSSQKDAMVHSVYPTPPPTLRKTYPNLHMLPDPSLVDLDGITLGVTSTDVVDHLLSYEFAANAGERMHRAINHLFHQGSFYPLYPPADEDMAYDSQLALKYAQIKQLPNVLILPGDQRHFIRLVSDCLVINPGRLSDKKGGTFARFLVAPSAPGKAANMFNSVACQVQRI